MGLTVADLKAAAARLATAAEAAARRAQRARRPARRRRPRHHRRRRLARGGEGRGRAPRRSRPGLPRRRQGLPARVALLLRHAHRDRPDGGGQAHQGQDRGGVVGGAGAGRRCARRDDGAGQRRARRQERARHPRRRRPQDARGSTTPRQCSRPRRGAIDETLGRLPGQAGRSSGGRGCSPRSR